MVDLSVSNSIKIVPSLISSPFLTATFKILAASIPSPKSLSIIGCFFSAVDFSGLSVGLVSVGSVSGVSVGSVSGVSVGSVSGISASASSFTGSSFEVSECYIVLAAANALLKQKSIDKKKHSEIVEKLNLNKDKINPMTK